MHSLQSISHRIFGAYFSAVRFISSYLTNFLVFTAEVSVIVVDDNGVFPISICLSMDGYAVTDVSSRNNQKL